MKHVFAAALCAAALSLLPAAGQAQGALGSMQLNIAAGAAIPVSDLGQYTDVGYNLTVGIGAQQHGSPLGFRAEGFYNEFGVSNTNLKTHAGGITANAVLNMSAAGAATGLASNLYLIGGIGWYSTSDPFYSCPAYAYSCSGDNSQSNLGYNIGAGFRFPLTSFSAYIEARYNGVTNADMRFIPITFGLVF